MGKLTQTLLPRSLLTPAVVVLLCWMLAPLVMTIYFSFVDYNLTRPDAHPFAGFANYRHFITNPDFLAALWQTLLFLGMVVAATVIGGILLALMVNTPFPGRGLVRVLLISPFFIMPTVNALLWKHMMMNPVYGVLANVWIGFGWTPIDWLKDFPLFSVTVMVSWQWLAFACLIFITSLQSLDREQLEAARMDGASAWQRFWHLTLPHLARPIAIVVMIEMIFMLSVFAEISITTGGGPGNASTNLTYLVYKQSLINFDVGAASAGALFAIIFANIIAIFLMRIVGKNLD